MANLDPLNSDFTTEGLGLAPGVKLTKTLLNKIANNTGWNWLGGRHPMFEAFGKIDFELEEVNLNDEGLLENLEISVDISSRIQGANQFTRGDTYSVFCVLNVNRGIPVVINDGSEGFATLLDIHKDFFGMQNITVFDKQPESFKIRFDMPQPTFAGGTNEISLSWFAKGY